MAALLSWGFCTCCSLLLEVQCPLTGLFLFMFLLKCQFFHRVFISFSHKALLLCLIVLIWISHSCVRLFNEISVSDTKWLLEGGCSCLFLFTMEFPTLSIVLCAEKELQKDVPRGCSVTACVSVKSPSSLRCLHLFGPDASQSQPAGSGRGYNVVQGLSRETSGLSLLSLHKCVFYSKYVNSSDQFIQNLFPAATAFCLSRDEQLSFLLDSFRRLNLQWPL